MGRDALIGAGLGGAIEGGINAYTAEPGNRGSAFMKGFGHGALTGAAGGAIMGGASGLIDNVGASALRQQAARVGLRGAKATSAAQAAGQRGFFGNVKDIFSRTAPEHGLGRRAAAINLAGTAAGLGTILMPTPTFSDEKTAEDALDIPEELPVVDAGSSPNSEDWRRYLLNPHTVAMMAGTGLGAAGTNVALDLLERQGHLPERSLQRILATRIAPVPGSILGATAGHYLGTKLTENDV
jgi:hypothetical protein